MGYEVKLIVGHFVMEGNIFQLITLAEINLGVCCFVSTHIQGHPYFPVSVIKDGNYVEKDNYGAVLYAIEMDVVVNHLIEYNKFSASGITYATPGFLQSLTEVYKKDYLYCVLYGY